MDNSIDNNLPQYPSISSTSVSLGLPTRLALTIICYNFAKIHIILFVLSAWIRQGSDQENNKQKLSYKNIWNDPSITTYQ